MNIIGRPVRVVSLSFRDQSLESIAARVDREAAFGADLIVLPEMFLGHSRDVETIDGPTVATMAAIAAARRTYIVCPMYLREGDSVFNTAVLLDRSGAIAGIYRKIYPYWSEFKLDPPPCIGSEIGVFPTDFGRVGITICFDVNFPDVWQMLADQGAELVVWPSAYSAGTALQAYALLHHYPIVSATLTGDCQVYDITGEKILDDCDHPVNISRITLDLDRCIFHENFNLAKCDLLLMEHGDDVIQEQHLEREQWFVLKSARSGVSARDLARERGLEELRDYIARSRRSIDARRALPLAASGAV